MSSEQNTKHRNKTSEKVDVWLLQYDFCFLIVLPIRRGRAPLFTFKYTVEIAHVVVSAFKTYLGNSFLSINQHTCGIAHSYVNNIIAQPSACVQLKEATERTFAHIGNVGQRF